MLHLLTEEHRQKVVTEYRKRVFTVIASGVVISALAGMVFLAPAFSATYGRYSETSVRKAALDAELSIKNDASNAQSVQDVSSAISALHVFDGKRRVTEIVTNVLRDMPAGIQIKNLIFTPSDNSSYIVDMAGRANTRDNLVAFSDNLKQNTYFDQVTVPLSSFARDKNIDFSVKLVVSGGVYIPQSSSSDLSSQPESVTGTSSASSSNTHEKQD